MLTYAQNFEDVMLERLFAGEGGGFYVDVGAWDPDRLSITRHFYDQGWRGINIEPIRRQFERFVERRPRDINLNLGIDVAPGRARFFECPSDTSLSTMDAAQSEVLLARGLAVEAYDIEVARLQDVLDTHCPGVEIDFLKIDVEGREQRVLQSIDLARRAPRVLLIEATRPAAPLESWDAVDAIGNWSAWEPEVLAAGYAFAHFDGLSRFYLRSDLRDRAARLRLPPGAFDRIEYPEEQELRRQVLQLHDELAARAEVIERLDAQLRSSERARSAPLPDIVRQRLHARLGRLKRGLG